jgi:hypothetical protein
MPPSNQESPMYCPWCGGESIIHITPWNAESLEPCDKGNTATINEYQCTDVCEGRSFWV